MKKLRSRRRSLHPSRISLRPKLEMLESRQLLAADPVLTELMAINRETIADDDGDFSDWFEVTNVGDEVGSLAGWHATDDLMDPDRWPFPDLLLEPGESLLLFASGKDRRQVGAPLHTNFRLSGEGEYLGLMGPTGSPVSEFLPTFPPQVSDVSYGLHVASQTTGYFVVPTPGAANVVVPTSGPPRSVMINEIMYHPPSHAVGDEFIELINDGTKSVDLSGWSITGGIDVVLPSAVMAPGEFLVVAADVSQFTATYGAVNQVVGPWSGQLSNRSDALRLRDEMGQIVDSVTYADEGDWAQRQRGPVDHGHRGWIWSDDHDGGGKSLELRNANLPNDWGQNWSASLSDQGTPGRENSVAESHSAPFIVDIQQQPPIPRAEQQVDISARLIDRLETTLTATLHWRLDGASDFNQQPMLDDGQAADILAGDRVYLATLPPLPDRTVVEYFISAANDAGHRRTWPAPTADAGQSTNSLYQVIDEFDATSFMEPDVPPTYYQIMTAVERAEFSGINRDSNAQMNATLITVSGEGVQLRHNASVRIRGSGSRRDTPPNNRVNIPSDQPLDGVTAINFNVDTVHNQIAGSLLFRLAGLPAAEAHGARMFSNGVDLKGGGMYAQLEPLGSEFADKHFPMDSGGNLYKGRRPNESPPGGSGAGLQYFGEDPAPYVSYTKLTNESLADWSDVINLTNVLVNAPDDVYLEQLAQVVDIDQWLRFFAMNFLVANTEGGLVNGDRNGDDYAMYRGVEDQRFVMIPHDLDSILSSLGRTNLFRAASVSPLARVLRHDELRSRYFEQFIDLVDNVFRAEDTKTALRDALRGSVGESQINRMVDFLDSRSDVVLEMIPQGLTYNALAPLVDGRIKTDEFRMGVYGTADYRANSVLVNGQLASFQPSNHTWQIGSFPNTTMVPTGAEWRYLDDGSDLGLDWRDLDFVTGDNWKIGDAELGYGDGGEATTIDFGDDPANRHITTYFRHEFDVDDVSRFDNLFVRLKRDDGAVVYLNGVEVVRSNLPSGEIDSSTLASSHVSGGWERTFLSFEIDPSRLRTGRNVIAVEVHQASANSADLSFDLRLRGRIIPRNVGADLVPGVNTLLIQATSGKDGTGDIVASSFVEVWREMESRQVVNSDLPADTITTWTLANSPYHVQGEITVPDDASLVIEPGVSVYFDEQSELIVRGTLTAQGTEHRRIRFTADPAAPHVPDRPGLPDGPPRWAGIHFERSRSSANVIAFADVEFAQDNDSNRGSIGVIDSDVVIDNVRFRGTHLRMIYGRNASMVVSNSDFPDMFAPDESPIELGLDNVAEHIKIIGRTPAGGQLVIRGNRFGTNKGHNDVIDADSNRVTNGPILQVLDNVFAGAGDELLDLGGDVYVAGNFFQGVFKDDTTSDRGYANVMSTGDAGRNTLIVVARNYFYDVDHAINLKNRTSTIFEHNTVVKVHPDFVDRFGHPNVGSAINFFVDEPGAIPGTGAYAAKNVFWDVPRVFGNADLPDEQVSALQLDDNLVSVELAITRPGDRTSTILALGDGNVIDTPRFVDEASLDFRLDRSSLAHQPLGPVDWGADVPNQVWIHGVPESPTVVRDVDLTIGGPGMFAYRYRVNSGPWSDELPIGSGFNVENTVRESVLSLTNLADGDYFVEVEGRDFAGNWQSVPTISPSWTVSESDVQVRINEIAAVTRATAGNGDWIELYNPDAAPISLFGYRLTDDANDLGKFVFREDAIIPARGYFLVPSRGPEGLGFGLNAAGETVHLVTPDLQIIDSIEFGLQLDGYTIGRIGTAATWQLLEPSPGNVNQHLARLGDSSRVVINEWLAEATAEEDFIELYNPDARPVAIGDHYLADAGDGAPNRHQMSPLSFIAGRGFQVMVADGDTNAGADHLGFRLSSRQETLRLSDPDLQAIDTVVYLPQKLDFSQGRYPDGGSVMISFTTPTPGWLNGAGVKGDFTDDGVVDGEDIDQFCVHLITGSFGADADLDRDGAVGLHDHQYLVEVILETTAGDANLDGRFDSADFVEIFIAGEYEDGIERNSTWRTGDWNCDAEFTSEDIVTAFLAGAYATASAPADVTARSSASAWRPLVIAAVDASLESIDEKAVSESFQPFDVVTPSEAPRISLSPQRVDRIFR